MSFRNVGDNEQEYTATQTGRRYETSRNPSEVSVWYAGYTDI
jgi:hypothetical protein